jgi:hypothetical protein
MLQQLKELIQPYKNLIIKILSGISLIFLFWTFCFHWTESYEIALTRNVFTKNLEIDSIGGFNLSSPWIQVVKIDTRPTRICITSSTRNFNCKLVQFDKEYYKEFIQTEGFRYYWWDNRISFNLGYDDEYRGMKDLLRGYTFDRQNRNFIRIIDEIQ